jgi:NMD protein affecting ribosome stability and mRNA decay
MTDTRYCCECGEPYQIDPADPQPDLLCRKCGAEKPRTIVVGVDPGTGDRVVVVLEHRREAVVLRGRRLGLVAAIAAAAVRAAPEKYPSLEQLVEDACRLPMLADLPKEPPRGHPYYRTQENRFQRKRRWR